MRIVNLTEFLDLPPNTVFMKYEPCVFETLSVKGDSLSYNDFYYSDIVDEIESSGTDEMTDTLCEAEKDSTYSIKLDVDIQGRDGSFHDEQLFGVYEQKDIDNLINRLKSCKGA